MTNEALPPLASPPILANMTIQAGLASAFSAYLANPANSYLFVGPTGSGKNEWALAFAAALVCPNGGCGTCPSCQAVPLGLHPDVNIWRNQDGTLAVREAESVIRHSILSPAIGDRRVIVVDEFANIYHVAPVLLKAIEEPPANTVFILMAQSADREMATIASRCVNVAFGPIGQAEIEQHLVAAGVSANDAAAAAQVAAGNLTRAVELAADGNFARRADLWQRARSARFSSGSALIEMTTEIIGFVDEIVAAQKQQGEARLAELAKQVKAGVVAKGLLKDAEADVARRLKYVRRSELDLGFALMLAGLRQQIADSGDVLRGFRQYQALDERVMLARRQLSFSVSEMLVLGTLLGAQR